MRICLLCDKDIDTACKCFEKANAYLKRCIEEAKEERLGSSMEEPALGKRKTPDRNRTSAPNAGSLVRERELVPLAEQGEHLQSAPEWELE